MKRWLAVFVWFLSALGAASDALVLIHPDRAQPVVSEGNYLHGEWILWPPEEPPTSGNRLLSLLSGTDWYGPKDALAFGRRGDRYISSAYAELRDRGYFAARDRVVDRYCAAVASDRNFVSPGALLLAMGGGSPEATILDIGDAWPALVVSEARTWDDVVAIARGGGGRVLVVEYPPTGKQRWSRYWLMGSGWSDRLPLYRPWSVPGLIPASQAGSLLLRPETFEWRENDVADWGGANRWLGMVAYYGPLISAVLLAFSVFFVGCATYLISSDEPARFASIALRHFTLFPAAILMAAPMTKAFGRTGILLWLTLAFVFLTIASLLVRGILARAMPRAHGMLGLGLVGLAATVSCDPTWSLFSHVLGPHPLPGSPEAVGALAGYLVMVCAGAKGSWPARLLVAALVAWAVMGRPWWAGGSASLVLLPLFALIAGERLFHRWMLPFAAVAPLIDGAVLRGGLTWAPGDLHRVYGRMEALNFARHAEFLVSPGFLVFAGVAGALTIFVDRYFFHKLRQTVRLEPRLLGMIDAGLLLAVAGIVQPMFLYGALMCITGGVFLILSDAARTIQP